MNLARFALSLFVVASFGLPVRAVSDEFPVTKFGAVPDDAKLDTTAIQAAIDAASAVGGGTVRFSKGRFISGGLQIKSHVRLALDQEAILLGSDNCRDYGEGRWTDALIKGPNAQNIRIEGPGLIDGVDCRNPKGEEGFRGPHAIFLTACTNIVITNLSIARSTNYAILTRNCADADLRRVSFRGGHDGLHAQACARYVVRDCEFRTGDDSIAGCDNVDFEIADCLVNSSCNGFRFGCLNLLVKNCRFWGPGEYQHRVSNRTNMLSAFVHFAPKDRNPKLPSDNWLIRDITIDNVDFVYGYDFERGLWQTGQPAKRLRFQNVKATRVAKPIRVLGDADRQFELTLDNVSIMLRDDRRDQEVFNVTRFGKVTLKNVTLQNSGQKPVLRAKDGNEVLLERVTCLPANSTPYAIEAVRTVTGP